MAGNRPTKMLGNRSAAAAETIYQRDRAKRTAEAQAKSASHHDNNVHKVNQAHDEQTMHANRSLAAKKANATRRRGGR